MNRLLLFALLCALGCGGSGVSRDTFEGSLTSVPGGTPFPGEVATVSLRIATNGSASGTVSSRGEAGTVSGSILNGVMDIDVDFPTLTDWKIRGDSRYYPITFDPISISGRVFVDSEEFSRTIHIYLGDISLVKR